jgi:hypothetical protein
MDLASLLCIIRVMERHLLLLPRGLLLAISVISMISAIGSIDLSIVLLLLPWQPIVS